MMQSEIRTRSRRNGNAQSTFDFISSTFNLIPNFTQLDVKSVQHDIKSVQLDIKLFLKHVFPILLDIKFIQHDIKSVRLDTMFEVSFLVNIADSMPANSS